MAIARWWSRARTGHHSHSLTPRLQN